MRRYGFGKHAYLNDSYQTPSNQQVYSIIILAILNLVFFCCVVGVFLFSCNMYVQISDIQKLNKTNYATP